MILDRENKIIYAVISQRTNPVLIDILGSKLGYQTCVFKASQYSE